MTERNEGMTCPLDVGDMVRIVQCEMIDEIGVISAVKQIVADGGRGVHRVTKQLVTFTDTAYILEDTGAVLYGRDCLYKLPPDFYTVTNLEAAQRIKKLLLTHTKD